MPAAPVAAQSQWRGIWADCFHPGFKSTAEIDTLVGRAAEGRYNAIVAEVLGFQDRGTLGHGAYWDSSIVPRAQDVSGGIDPLSYLCNRAAAHGIQVHAWLVTYRVCETWPPVGNTFLAGHPEFLSVPRAGIDADPVVPVGKHYLLDPGSPDVQDYLVSIVRELVSRYPIDGINWDYVRYTQYDAGYPARSSYEMSGLKRFQRIYNRTDVPSSSDSSWNDFRRRTIDELVRRCRAEIVDAVQDPDQAVIQTADVLATWYAPSSFTSSQAYLYFQNWKLWAESGWLDAVIPMNYKREHCPDQAAMFRSWIDKAVIWKGPRHAYCGQGSYLNSMADSVSQMQYVLNVKGAEGACNYSYWGSRAMETICDDNDPWTHDPAWFPYVAGAIYTAPASPPSLPWRDPATAVEGTVWGQVLQHTTGEPLDDATVTVSERPAVKTDGNGYYTVTLVPATPAGRAYPITVSKAGITSTYYPAATVYAGSLVRYDFSLGAPAPIIELSTTSLNPTAESGQNPPEDVLQVRASPGRAPLNYTVSVNADWLSVSPSAGISRGEEDEITVAYNATGLTAGTHIAAITVSDPYALNNPQSVAVRLWVPKACDFDQDEDVDQEDFGHLQKCLTGVGVPQILPACLNASVDGDSDVDENDVQIFITCLSGPNVPSDPNCFN